MELIIGIGALLALSLFCNVVLFLEGWKTSKKLAAAEDTIDDLNSAIGSSGKEDWRNAVL